MRSVHLMSILVASCVAATAGQSAWAETEDDSNKITSRIPREPVASSAIAAVGYSKRRQILEIEFRNGAIYRYLSVPRSAYHDLMAAESKTRYYDKKIKGNYKSFRVRQWQTKPER
jgi:hypothetical protein